MKVPMSLRAEGDRVALRAPRVRDAERLIEIRRRSWSFLAPWSPLPGPDADDVRANRRSLSAQRREWEEDRAYRFVVTDRATDRAIGRVALGEVVRGVFQNAYLGYWIDASYAHKGLMTEAVRLSLALALGPIGLHRVQAAIMPHNVPSLALARRVGLREEGLARRYLKIAGAWEDHVLFAVTAEELPGASV
jgi:ribosomal-protein-alanine N-acetyltransferase